MDMIQELKHFAEEHKTQMSIDAYEYIYNIIQSIEHETKEE